MSIAHIIPFDVYFDLPFASTKKEVQNKLKVGSAVATRLQNAICMSHGQERIQDNKRRYSTYPSYTNDEIEKAETLLCNVLREKANIQWAAIEKWKNFYFYDIPINLIRFSALKAKEKKEKKRKKRKTNKNKNKEANREAKRQGNREAKREGN